MINYTCDVCGVALPQDYKRMKQESCSRLISLTKVDDVCPRCLKVGAKLDETAILREAWKRAADQTTTEAEGQADPSKKPQKKPPKKDPTCVNKAEIRDRLAEFKRDRGLGAMPALEKAVNRKAITVPVLLSASTGAETLHTDQWAAIDRGLDKLGAPAAGHGENN